MTEALVHQYAKQRLTLLSNQGKALFFHVPNGLKRSPVVQAKLKNMGLKPGVADFCIVWVGGQASFLEVKGPDGRTTKQQDEFRGECERVGAWYAVGSSVDEVSEILTEWASFAASGNEEALS